MRGISLILFMLFSALAFGGPMDIGNELELGMDYSVESSVRDDRLQKDQAKFTVIVDHELPLTNRTVLYSIDGNNDQHLLSEDLSFSIPTSPGEHDMQFAIDEDLNEIIINNLKIKPGYHTTIRLLFRVLARPMILKKPVIYLYPESETEVNLKIKTDAELTFMYPSYKNGWDVLAQKDGAISVKERKYRYLFWEANTSIQVDFDFNNGFAVEKYEIITFLEKQLEQFGFNDQEKEDFITFWGPKLIQFEACKIHFLINEECDQFAQIAVKPQPDQVLRLYMVWSPIENINDFDYLHPQKIASFKRFGFTILEWGGAEMPLSTLQKETL